jgi:hypothetical protein
MFNPDKKFAPLQLVYDVIKTLGKSFDVLSIEIKNNKIKLVELEQRIKEIEDKQ